MSRQHGWAPHETGQFARNSLATLPSPLQYGLIVAPQGWPITPDPLMLSAPSVQSTVGRQKSAKPSNAFFAVGVILFPINVRQVGVQKARKALAHAGGQTAGTISPSAGLGHAASKDWVSEHDSKDALVVAPVCPSAAAWHTAVSCSTHHQPPDHTHREDHALGEKHAKTVVCTFCT